MSDQIATVPSIPPLRATDAEVPAAPTTLPSPGGSSPPAQPAPQLPSDPTTPPAATPGTSVPMAATSNGAASTAGVTPGPVGASPPAYGIQVSRDPDHPDHAQVTVHYPALAQLQHLEAEISVNTFTLPIPAGQPPLGAPPIYARHSDNAAPTRIDDTEVSGVNRLSAPDRERLEALYAQTIHSHDALSPSHVLLMNSRQLSDEVIRLCQAQPLRRLRVANLPPQPGPEDLPYPPLCIYGPLESLGEARVAQAVFTALLRYELFHAGCPMEVVARQGFGSLFPTTADVGPGGFRVSWGMLAPRYAGAAVQALQKLDAFLDEFAQHKATLAALIETLDQWGPRSDGQLAAVIHALMHTDLHASSGPALHARILHALAFPDRTLAQYPSLPDYRPAGQPLAHADTFTVPGGAYLASHDGPWAPTRRPLLKTQHSRYERDPSTEQSPTLVGQSVYTASGMHGIQIIDHATRDYLAAARASRTAQGHPVPPAMARSALRHRGYYELETFLRHDGCCFIDRAGNPTSLTAPEGLPPMGSHAVRIEDVTNLSVTDRHRVLEAFKHALKQDRELLLVFVSSESKWDGYGDTVTGKLQIFGVPEVVNQYLAYVDRYKRLEQTGPTAQELERRYAAAEAGSRGTRTLDILNQQARDRAGRTRDSRAGRS